MTCRLLLVSGSLRQLSSSAAVLRLMASVAPPGVSAAPYERLAHLPAFNPDDDAEPLHPEVVFLRGEVHKSDAVVFSTPEYAGALPGSFKNLLDWTIGDDQAGSIYGKPAAWVNASPRGAEGAHRELRTVLEYAHAAIVEAACRSVPVTSAMIGPDGTIADPETAERVGDVLRALVDALVD